MWVGMENAAGCKMKGNFDSLMTSLESRMKASNAE